MIDIKDQDVRYQKIDIVVPNPTAANALVEQAAQLDRDYNKIIGIAFFEAANGGVPNNYNVGFRTSRKQWQEDINILAWLSSNVGPMGKFFEVNIAYGSGDPAYVRITPNAATIAAMSGQMVLILAKDLTEQPKA